MKKPEPFFKEPYTAAAIAADAPQFPYFCVLLQSLMDHMGDQNHYDIIVLSVHLTEKMKQTACQSVSECRNLMLRFINLVDQSASLEQAKRYLPFIMEKYNRVIYLEPDWVLSDDIAKSRNHCNYIKSRDFLDLERMSGNSSNFWKYARMSSYYEWILEQAVVHTIQRHPKTLRDMGLYRNVFSDTERILQDIRQRKIGLFWIMIFAKVWLKQKVLSICQFIWKKIKR